LKNLVNFNPNLKKMKEIERKFLIVPHIFVKGDSKTYIKQGYLSVDPLRVVRIRKEGRKACITVKGKAVGISRQEFEYRIPVKDADELLKMALFHPVEKIRHQVQSGATSWIVDEFLGENKGLWIAEVELEREDQPFTRPEWLGEEVTSDPRYYNSRLAQNPFKHWKI